MAFQVNDNIELNSPKPLDPRFVFQTYDDMIAFPSIYLYDGIITYCKDTKKYYSGKLNEDTNKIEFEIFASGGLVTRDGVNIYVLDTQQQYNDLVANGVITDETKDIYLVLEGNESGGSGTGGSDTSNEYIHIQSTASSSWVVNHNLNNKYPNLIILDNDENELEGQVQYVSDIQTIITFDSELTGKVIARK